jgi:hypothetical protein
MMHRLGGLLAVSMCFVSCAEIIQPTELERRTYRQLQYDDRFEPSEPSIESQCHLHHVPTVQAAVPLHAGMCVVSPSNYLRAHVQRFPNSYWSISTCSCEWGNGIYVIRYACPICRNAERAWRIRHGWPTEDEIPFQPEPATS